MYRLELPPEPQPVAEKSRTNLWLLVLVLGAAMLVIGFLVGRAITETEPGATAAPVVSIPTSVSPAPTNAPSTSEVPTTESTPPVTIAGGELVAFDASLVGVAVVPSVVTVEVLGPNGQQLGSGSGVVYDTQGRIITNDHVVGAGSGYRIVLSDGRTYQADLLGTDASTDLAVLDVAAEGLVPIRSGAADSLRVGDPAVAVGSPLGLDGGPSLTVGVISAFGREVQTDATTQLFGMIQTDAPITQGSSGGALVDGSGNLIGITTAVGVSSVGIEGIGFATPIEIVQRVVGEIIAAGSASQPFLGITGSTEFGDLADGGLEPIGVFVESVQSGSAAALGGITQGVVVTSIAGSEVATMDELITYLKRFSAGDEVAMTVLSAGESIDLTITLGDR